jgi:D-galactarolactone isomerase
MLEAIGNPDDPGGGICDCHIHFYGAAAIYALAPTAQYEPPMATPEQYRAVMSALNIERLVAVQPVGYGYDNRCMLDSMQSFEGSVRGIVTVPADVPESELARLDSLGVRGVRFFMFPGGLLGWGDLEGMAARIQPFGWHIQLQMDGRELPERCDLLKRLPTPLVIDHTGKFIVPEPVGGNGVNALVRLLDGGKCWVKLSAPYETSKLGPPDYADVGEIAKRLISVRPDRMLWATNWPHGRQRCEAPADLALLRVLDDWVADPDLRARVLIDNPAALYGF